MGQAMPHISAVGAAGDGIIQVKWKDHSSNRIDLSGWIETGGATLAPLRNPAVFGSPRIADDGASIAWGEDDDLRIDAVHLKKMAEGRPRKSA
jgi:hypothetical protein